MLYGYSREEFLQLTIKDIRPEEDIAKIIQATENESTYGEIHKKVWRHLKKNGELMYVEVTGHLLDYNDRRSSLALINDITERKKAAEALQQKNKFIESIINASPNIIYIYDIEERKNVYTNDGIQTNLGYTDVEIKEMGNQVLPTLMHPEDFEVYLTDIFPKYSTTKDKEIITHEFRMKNKNGNWYWLDCKESIFLRTPDGIPKQIFGIVSDITERKKAEKTEYELHTRLKAIFEKTNDAIVLADDSGNYVQVNPAAAKMLGYSQHELTGMNAADITSGRQTDELWNEFMQDGSQTGAIELLRKDGSLVICHYNATSNILPGLHLSILTDITERKKAEQAIKESEARLAASQSVAKVGSWETDLTNLIVIWSDEACRIFGVDNRLPHTTHENFLQFVHPDDREKVDKAFAASFTSDSVNLIEHRIIAADGVIKEIEERWLIAKDENGKAIRALGTVQDITERKKAESKLNENENYLRTILDTVPECVKVLNSKGELLYMNPAGLAIIEADNEQQVLGTQMTDMVDQKYRIGFNRLTKEVFKGNSGTFEFEITGLKGSHRWMETNAVPLKDTTGKIVNLLGATRDITVRKKAEEAVKNTEERRKLIMNSALDAIICIDKDGMITFWNPQAEQIFGWSENEVMGKVLSSIIIPEHFRSIHDSGMKNYLKTGEGKAINVLLQLYAIRRNGTEFPIELTVLPIRQDGEEFFCAFIRDITERKDAEKEIFKTTAELHQLTDHLQTIREDERKRIAREIHDDLGQQLTAIKMDTVWIDKQIPAETVAVKNKLQNMLELLDGSHQSVRKILNELRPAALDDNGLLEALQWQGRQFTETTGIPVHFKTNIGSSNLTNETATCIFRVYQESLTNIMRYAHATVVVSSLKSRNGSIILAIEDDGKGFDTALSETKKRFGLLGMKERVISLNGKFDLVSSPGKGTKIVIRLPYKNIEPVRPS